MSLKYSLPNEFECHIHINQYKDPVIINIEKDLPTLETYVIDSGCGKDCNKCSLEFNGFCGLDILASAMELPVLKVAEELVVKIHDLIK